MKFNKTIRLAWGGLVLVAAVALVTSAHLWAQSSSPLSKVHPAAIRSSDAVVPEVAGPNYGLFRCQVGTDRLGRTCYDPYQMRHAYNIDSLINSGFTGKGKTIVIVDAFQSPHIVNQLNTYIAFYGLPSMNGLGGPYDPNLGTFTQIAPNGLTPFNPNDPNMIGWAEEISLDVLWAHSIAPGANIVLALATDNSDAALASVEKYVVDNRLGDIMSQSFGENESCVAPDDLATYNEVFAEATRKNITVFASAGDWGASQGTCDGNSWVKAASSPASSPLVTGVGGTELHAANYCLTALGCNPAQNPVFGTYEGEITWNEGPPFGDFQSLLPPPSGSAATGGGFSVVYDEPSYQQGTIHGGKQRAVPDVAYNAAIFHGVLTYLDIPNNFGIASGFYLFGGTSCGSPQWSALMAIADQKAGTSLGFINKALYRIGQAQSHYSASLHDVTSGTNSVVEYDVNNNPVTVLGFSAGSGWDPTTGLGSPIADQLVDYLAQFVSPGDGTSAIAETKPHGGNPSAPGHVKSH